MTSESPFTLAEAAAAEVRHRLDGEHDVAVVLGSGWAPAIAALGAARHEVAMAEVSGFPAPSVLGHRGTMLSVDAGGRRVLVLAGRSHLYEGHSPATVVHGVRAAVLAGCRSVVLTNAAGGLRDGLAVRRPVLISDHVNLTGASPMAGVEPPSPYGSRFVDLSAAYSPRLRGIARAVDPSLEEGVYAAMPGPHYETPAEIRMLQRLGADLVGMSTVLEAIAAVHLGAEVLGVSLVTNLAAGLSPGPLDHTEVLAAGRDAAAGLGDLLRAVVDRV